MEKLIQTKIPFCRKPFIRETYTFSLGRMLTRFGLSSFLYGLLTFCDIFLFLSKTNFELNKLSTPNRGFISKLLID